MTRLKRSERYPRLPSRTVYVDGIRCVTLPLNRGMEAIVDEADFPKVSKYLWTVDTDLYVHRMKSVNGKKTKIYLHRELTGFPSMSVDHRNGNRLDYRRCNLRKATDAQQIANSLVRKRAGSKSIYKGVSWHRTTGMWFTRICIKGRQTSLGYFRDEKEAGRAYDRVALKLHGEFACLNFPPKGERGCVDQRNL